MRKEIQFLLVLSMSFLIVLFPAYLCYNDLLETDFPSSHLIFQNIGSEDLLGDWEEESFAFESFDLSIISPTRSFREFAHFSFEISSFKQEAIIYRC